MKRALIISGNLAQDHEFIYPYYRLLEAEFTVDVCLLEGKPVKGILGTALPPNKNQEVKIAARHHLINSYKCKNIYQRHIS